VAKAVGDLLTPSHLIIILILALLVFGPRRLPELGASIGKTIKEFQRSMKEATEAHTETKAETTQSSGTEAGKS
jgi:sec-independent protein translocase protein TatA